MFRQLMRNQLLTLSVLAALVAITVLGRWSPERLNGLSSLEYGFDIRYIFIVFLALGIFIKGDFRPVVSLGTTTFLIAPLVFFALSGAWTISGADTGYLVRKIYEVYLTIITLLAMPIIIRDRNDLRSFQILLLVACGLVVAVSFFTSSLGLALASRDGDSSRLAVLGGGPNILARFAFTSFIVALTIGLRLKEKVYLALSAVSLLVLILTGSRGGMAACVALFLVWSMDIAKGNLWVKVRHEKRKKSPIARYAVIAILASAFVAIIAYLPQLQNVRDVFTSRITLLTFQKGYTSDRDVLLDQAVALWAKSPYFGEGAGAFSSVNLEQYPHNLFLEFLCETGFVGLFLLVAGMFMNVRYMWRHRTYLDQTFFPLFVGALVAAQFSGDLYDSRIVFIYEMLCVISISVSLPVPRRAVKVPARKQSGRVLIQESPGT